MKALVYHGHEDVRLSEIPKPQVKTEDEVLIKVEYAGICGSDLARIIGSMGRKLDTPVPHGHEFSGIVEEIGASVHDLKPGDRVAVAPKVVCGACENCTNNKVGQCSAEKRFIGVTLPGGWASYCVLPRVNLVKLPDSVSAVQGAFFEPLTVAIHSAMISKFQTGSSAAVMGCGSIGLLMVQTLHYFGASNLSAFDINEEKLSLAKKYGSAYEVNTSGNWIDQANEITGGRLYDFVFEAGGVEFTEKASILLAGAQATVAYVGTPFSDIHFTAREFEEINRRELWLKGIWQSYSTPFPGEEWTIAGKMFSEGKVQIDELIDRVIKPEELHVTLEDIKNKKVTGKVLIDFSKEV